MGYVNQDLEQDWWAKSQQMRGMNHAKADAAHAAQMAASRDQAARSSGGVGGGFTGAQNAAFAGNSPLWDAAANANRELAQGQDMENAWAAGRQMQHERNLQNAAMEEKFYGHDTDRYTADAQRQGVEAIARGINSIPGNPWTNGDSAGGGANGFTINDANGNKIGGGGYSGSPLAGLTQNLPQQQQQYGYGRRR